MRIVLIVSCLVLIAACSRHGNNNPSAPPVVDTLSTGWKKVTIPSLPFASDIFFINNTTGFVVAGNFIYRSTDGGNTWQKVYQSSSSTGQFVNIAMGSPANAVFTTSQKMLITSDGGNSFDSVVLADNAISDAFFVSPTVVYVIGQKFWKSTNGGKNWTSLIDLGGSGYRSLYFLNEQTGWFAGTGGVYFTSNGGTTWNQQNTTNFSFAGTGNVFFIDPNNGFISDEPGVGKSTNGGTSWTRVKMLGSGGYHDLHFLSSSTGYVTDGWYIFKTIDGGATWTKEVRLAKDPIIELHFTDVNHGWATAGDGYILKYE